MGAFQLIARLLLVFLVGAVSAETVTIDGKTYDRVPTVWLPNGDARYFGSTPAEACSKFADAMDPSCRTMDVISGPECRATCVGGFQKSWAIIRGCPAGYNITGGGDACLKEITRSPDEICAMLGDLGGPGSKWLYKGSGLSTCRGDCVFIPESSGYDKTTGYTIAWGPLINQGISCGNTVETESTGYADSEPDKPADAPHAGEKGYCPGQYNGATVWVKCASTTENTATKAAESTTSTASGATSGSTSTTTSGGTSTTKCDGATCTTTNKQTTFNADGSKTEKETTSTVPQSDYCKSNPSAAACKSSSWSGDCASGFSGDGDAVQVATARAVWEAKCEIGKRDSDAENKFNEIKSDTLSALNVSDRVITAPVKPIASCAISDMSVTVGDFVVPFNLSGICPYLATIQKVITAFGSLMWLMIVFRG